ncbi:DNA helicase II [Clostridium homopropionicum DSM 5847]|uniref:DNA 3'-5' helicase n=2 Tax=Clostridium TaxID=1485 RepID=A0A0L6ZEH8_9CLOT|nr:ATP-dependent helicase [Clostridium homopropionicum]KOA21381.1 DNA helicase II [Clostridium homopropionicum DSM 5847]SFG11751.1 DNA helicase-2 / ATP-dependent DNA helicase PcrA [Clostridium homopropionicum]
MMKNLKDEFCSLRDLIIEKRYCNLNNQQKEAVLSNQDNLALIACPGAGKTTTLINRLDYLVNFGNTYKSDIYPENITEEDIYLLKEFLKDNSCCNTRLEYILKYRAENPENIVVITFTRAAALNMKNRYNALNNSNRRAPFFGTFHGLFYKILSRHYNNINIINTSEAYRVIKSILSLYLDEVSEDKMKEILNYISLFKTSGETLEEFSVEIDKGIFKECYKAYEDYKSEKNLLDFDDLQIKCKEIFTKNPTLLEGYRKIFKYILVDEFQDCDLMQISILKLLNEGNSLFAVGDEDQCIYSFRGAEPECLVNFSDHFKNGKKLYLSINYRCPKSVIEISNNLIKNNLVRNDKIMESYKNSAPIINIFNYFNEGKQAEGITTNIVKLMASSAYEYEDNAVLYRTNVESRSIIDSFIRNKIPFRLLDKEYNFFEHFICKDILAYLKLSLDANDRESFLRVINRPFRYISKINIDKVKKHPFKEDCFEILKSIESIPVFQLKTIDKIKKDIQSLNKMSLAGAINFILTGIGYFDYLKEYGTKYKMDFSELEEIVEEFIASSEGYTSIITFLAHVSEVEEKLMENKDIKKGVILSTIHGVKGMEFKNIFIINCNEEIIPHGNSIESNLEEERRLFYVGITRAIENLTLSISNEIRGKSKEISRFIKECNLSAEIQREYNVGDYIMHKSFGKGRVEFFDSNRIEISFENEIKRSFDPVIVVNNGLIKKIG